MWHVDEIAEIIDGILQQEGKAILQDRRRIAAFCGDLLVNYREEYRIIQMLFREGLGECIEDYPAASIVDLNNSVFKIRDFTRLLGCSSEITDSVVDIFKIVLYPEYERCILEITNKMDQFEVLLDWGNQNEIISSNLCELVKDYSEFWKEEHISFQEGDLIASYIMDVNKKQIRIQICIKYVSDKKASITANCYCLNDGNDGANCLKIRGSSKVYTTIKSNVSGNQLAKKYKQLVESKKQDEELQIRKEKETIHKLRGMQDSIAERLTDGQRSQYALVDFTPPNKVVINDLSFSEFKRLVDDTKHEHIYWQLIKESRQRTQMGIEEQTHIYRTLYDRIFLEATIVLTIDRYGLQSEKTILSLPYIYSQNVYNTFQTKNFLSVVRNSWQILQKKIDEEEIQIAHEKNSIWFMEDQQYNTWRLRNVKKEKRIHFGSRELGQPLSGEKGYSLYDMYYEKPSSYDIIKRHHFIDKEIDFALRKQKQKLTIEEFKLRYKFTLDEQEYITATKKGLLDWYKMVVNSYGKDAGDFYVAEYSGVEVIRIRTKSVSGMLRGIIEDYIKNK